MAPFFKLCPNPGFDIFIKDHLFLQTFSRDDVLVDGKVISILRISLFQHFLWAHFSRFQSNVYKGD